MAVLPSRTSSNAAGKTRVCPHCKSMILDSATVCPGCKHHLQFNPGQQPVRAIASFTALSVEGKVVHPANESPWEYSLVISVRNERGEEVNRQVVGVGALNPGDERTVSLDMQVFRTNKPML